jgi:hypothetical protein
VAPGQYHQARGGIQTRFLANPTNGGKYLLIAQSQLLYERFAQAGHSGTDFSGIINFVREASKQG